jgi:hypothetical protein
MGQAALDRRVEPPGPCLTHSGGKDDKPCEFYQAASRFARFPVENRLTRKMHFTLRQVAANICILMVCGKTLWIGGFARLNDLTVSCKSLRTGAAHLFSIKHNHTDMRKLHVHPITLLTR